LFINHLIKKSELPVNLLLTNIIADAFHTLQKPAVSIPKKFFIPKKSRDTKQYLLGKTVIYTGYQFDLYYRK